ncbi:MAG TPA: hypothetical protein VHK88_09935 [Aquihabitans sp.]|nr:hypothetical protein [Aquihabitans sp.]
MSARRRLEASARIGFERLPERTRLALRDAVNDVRGLRQIKRNQAVLARRLADVEAQLRARSGHGTGPTGPADARFPDGIRSRVCTAEQFDEPWYATWCERLGEVPRTNRKQWEHAYIARAADEVGVVRPGTRALGFGVGQEPLVAFLAGQGVEVVATDLDLEDDGSLVWHNTGQHASSLDPLRRPALCPDGRFDELVSWRPVDMRSVPTDLVDFDLCWSSCCFEHLGSLDAGLAFVEASLGTLRPGGVAIHTTEFNLSSDDATIDHGSVVLYRRRDLEAFTARMEAAGHEVAALDLAPGTGVLDEFVDVPPFVDDPHIRIALRGHVGTSVALVIRKAGGSA